jgi:hypothetical protein
MILLASGNTLAKRHGAEPWIGQLITPDSRQRIVVPRWAADNAAFTAFDPLAYRRMVEAIALHPVPPIFVTVPDTVGNAADTRHRFAYWYAYLRPFALPLGYVLQDGERAEWVPWPLIAAVFVGGTTAFKVGATARALVREAHDRGRWVHMGRVNTVRRIHYAQQIGCDSIDGSGFSKWPTAMIHRFTRINNNGALDLGGPQC